MRCRIPLFPVLAMALFGSLTACPSYGQTQREPRQNQGQEIDVLLERAQKAQAKAHYAEAAALYASATKLSPATPELWSNRGIMEFLSGATAASVSNLQQANRLNPNLLPPLLFLGKAYLQIGKPASALPFLTRAHAMQPNDVEVLLSLGKANADLEQSRAAAIAYAQAAQSAPANAGAWFGLGVASLKMIHSDGDKLATTQPHSVWARALYSDELFAQGRPLEASDTYKEVFTEASPSQQTMLMQVLLSMQSRPDLSGFPSTSKESLAKLIANLEATTNRSPPRCSSESSVFLSPPPEAAVSAATLEAAGCAYLSGDYDRSAVLSQNVLRDTPQDPQALYWSVKASERIAVAALARFEELSPDTAANHVLVGDLYRYQRNPDGALNEYKKALLLDPHDASAMLGFVLAGLTTSDLQEAAEVDRRALADHPLDPQFNLLMAEILDAGTDHSQEPAYLAKALKGPADLQPRVHLLLGRIDAENGKTAEAIEQLQLALPSDKDGSTHYQLARLYRKTGNTAEANKVMEQAKVLIGKREANATIVIREANGTNQ